MASWAAVLALTGFEYDGVTARLTFAPATKPAVQFWSNGGAWGTFRQEPERDTISCHLTVREGRVKLQTFTLTGFGSARLKTPRSAAGGEAVSFTVQRDCFSDLD
jgi:hypothetical protein